MTVRVCQDASKESTKLCLVTLDTDVLIEYLDVMNQFDREIELGLPITIVIPNVLLPERDGCVDYRSTIAHGARPLLTTPGRRRKLK